MVWPWPVTSSISRMSPGPKRCTLPSPSPISPCPERMTSQRRSGAGCQSRNLPPSVRWSLIPCTSWRLETRDGRPVATPRCESPHSSRCTAGRFPCRCLLMAFRSLRQAAPTGPGLPEPQPKHLMATRCHQMNSQQRGDGHQAEQWYPTQERRDLRLISHQSCPTDGVHLKGLAPVQLPLNLSQNS